MNIVGEANRDTPVYRGISGDSAFIIGNIKKGTRIKIQKIEKLGLRKYYVIDKNYTVSATDIDLIRDLDFYYSNVKSKKVMKNNLRMVGGKGISSVLDSYIDTGYTSEFSPDIQRFKSSNYSQKPAQIINQIGAAAITVGAITSGAYQQEAGGFAVGGGFGGRTTTGDSTLGTILSGTYTGGCFGDRTNPIINYPGTRTESMSDPNGYAQNVEDQQLTAVLGQYGINVKQNSTIGKLLNGISVGDMLEGYFFDILIDNTAEFIGDWLLDKLSYVVGFDIEAVLTALFNLFGINWKAIFSGNYAAFMNAIGYSPDFDEYDLESPDFGNGQYQVRSGYGVHFFYVHAGQGDLWKFNYAPVTQQMIDYFKYKGCDGRMITRHFGDLAWVQDETYETPTLEYHRDEQEIQVWKTLYNEDYSAFTDSMNLIRNEFNLYIDRQTMATKFNRFRVPTPDNELTATRAYIFFTRPDLNLNMNIRGQGEDFVGSARVSPMMANLLHSHPVITSYLMGDAAGTDNRFIPILGNRCTGLDVSDEVLETVEAGESYTGWKFVYGTSLIKSKTAGTVNVSFIDDDMLSVYKLIKAWCEYISAVYRGEAMPKQCYIDYHQLDYATSIYYFLCKATSDNQVLFWTKYTGVFPTAIPSSTFSDQLGNVIHRPQYSVPFTYMRKDDFNMLNIAEFNNLGDTSDFEYMPVYNPDTMHTNKSFVGAPFVDTNDGSRLFKLKFRPA